jgi:hypothetical protein
VADYADYQDIWQNVLDHGFSSAQYQQYAKDAVNQAQREVAKRLDVRAWYAESSLNTTGGSDVLTLPTDFLRADYLYNDTDDDPLDAAEDGLFIEQYGTTQGKPLYWIVLGTQIRLRPIPDAVYALKLRYYKRPTAMSADGDVPEIPLEHRHLLETYAVAKCFRREGDREMHNGFMADFERDLALSAEQLQFDHESPPPARQVPGAW